MASVIADTDVLIDFLRHRASQAVVKQLLQSDALTTTTISAFELRCGIRTKREEQAVESLLRSLVIYPFDDSAATKAAEIHRVLTKKNHSIGMADSMIAAICMSRQRALLTNNHQHFSRIEGLRLYR